MLGNHLLGIYEKALDPEDSWKERLEKAKTLGFDFIEISIDESDERLARLDLSNNEIEELRRTCYEVGIGFQSMCLSAHRRFPFGSKDVQIRDRAHRIMTRAIDVAQALGIRVIQLAGYDVYYEESTPESIELFKQAMKWSADQAAKKQVMLAMEIMDTRFMNSITKFMPYKEFCNSPWFMVYPDMGNISAWPENNPDHEFEIGAGSIVGIHIKETLTATDNFPGKFKCVPFGTGCVDYIKRFKQMEDLGYTGPYVIEMWYEKGTSDLVEVGKAKAWIEEQYRQSCQ